MGISKTIAVALLLSSEACAAQTTINKRRRKVKIYSSSSIRRGEATRDAMDPYLGLPDERKERHLDVPIASSMSVSIASMSIPASLAASMPAVAASMPALSFSLPTTVAPASCIEIYDPVCGEDGKTYSNDCKAGLANVKVAYEGKCEKKKPTTKMAPDSESVTTTTVLLAADFTTLSDEMPTSPTPIPNSDLGINFEATEESQPSSAKMIGQSAVVLATAMCAAAGVVALV